LYVFSLYLVCSSVFSPLLFTMFSPCHVYV
jgi:hypothetical protein